MTAPSLVAAATTATYGSTASLAVVMPATVLAGECLLVGLWTDTSADFNGWTGSAGWLQAETTICNLGFRPPETTGAVNGALGAKPNAAGDEDGTTVSFARSVSGDPNASAVV